VVCLALSIGCIYAHSHFYSAIGHQVGVAVENARLAEEAAGIEILQELNRLRSELIANISHEVRTPRGIPYYE